MEPKRKWRPAVNFGNSQKRLTKKQQRLRHPDFRGVFKLMRLCFKTAQRTALMGVCCFTTKLITMNETRCVHTGGKHRRKSSISLNKDIISKVDFRSTQNQHILYFFNFILQVKQSLIYKSMTCLKKAQQRICAPVCVVVCVASPGTRGGF